MKRPTVLTVFAILNFVVASWAILGALLTFVMMLLPRNPAMANPALDLMRENPTYGLYAKATLVIGVLAALVLIVAGTGLLMVRPWGRSLSIGYAVYAIFMALVNAVVSFTWLLEPMAEQMAQTARCPKETATLISVGSMAVGACIALIYPILLLIFMNRRSVLAAMRGEAPADPLAPADPYVPADPNAPTNPYAAPGAQDRY